MISEKRVMIAGGAGGPNDNAIPVYGDNKAPNGAWAYDLNGKQLMWENGGERIIVNPELLTPAENEGQKFFNFKANGDKNYCRTWLVGEDGHGAVTQPFWVEYSKLIAALDSDPEPEPEPIGEKYQLLSVDYSVVPPVVTLKKV